MNKFTSFVVVILTILVVVNSQSGLVAGYGQIDPTLDATAEPTAFYENGGPFPSYPLTCPADMPVSEGPTWRTITIGRSSVIDLEEIYGVQVRLDTPRE